MELKRRQQATTRYHLRGIFAGCFTICERMEPNSTILQYFTTLCDVISFTVYVSPRKRSTKLSTSELSIKKLSQFRNIKNP